MNNFPHLFADAFQNPPFCYFATFDRQEYLDKTICRHFDKQYFRHCYVTEDGRGTDTSQTIGKGTDFGTDPESFSALNHMKRHENYCFLAYVTLDFVC